MEHLLELSEITSERCQEASPRGAGRGLYLVRAFAIGGVVGLVGVFHSGEGNLVTDLLDQLAGDEEDTGLLHHRVGVELLLRFGSRTAHGRAEGADLAEAHAPAFLQVACQEAAATVEAGLHVGTRQGGLLGDALAELPECHDIAAHGLGVITGRALGSVFRPVLAFY